MESKKHTIVIVDDVQENIQVLSNILISKGYNLAFAHNGKHALEVIQKKRPDLVLMDVTMPEMNGFEACQRLQEDKSTKSIPIIFITAKTDSEDVIEGFKNGGVDYISKPFNSDELLARVKTHLELKDAREELVDLNATKDKFFRIIGHDLKAPIGQLIYFSELIEDNIDDFDQEDILEFIRSIKDSSSRGFKLLENLLDWARSQTGNFSFNPEPLNLQEVTNENIKLLEKHAEAKAIHLHSSIAQDCIITADKNMLSTVIRNLIANAIKFTKQQGEVTIQAHKNNTAITVSVIDNGVGISPESIKKIFKIDAEHTTLGTNNEKGTGIGLILCQEFIQKHNGQIWAESTEGAGSIFNFKIPIQ